MEYCPKMKLLQQLLLVFTDTNGLLSLWPFVNDSYESEIRTFQSIIIDARMTGEAAVSRQGQDPTQRVPSFFHQ